MTSTPNTSSDSLGTTTRVTRATLTRTDTSTYVATSPACVRDSFEPTLLCYYQVMARTDDVINVAGHRITTGSIEEVIQAIPEVIECAVVRMTSVHEGCNLASAHQSSYRDQFGVEDKLKGHVPVALLVIANEHARSDDEVRSDVSLSPEVSKRLANMCARLRSK